MGYAARKLETELELQGMTMVAGRSRKRTKLRVAAELVNEREVASGVATRLSEYGAVVMTDMSPPLGSLVALRLCFAGDVTATVLGVVRGTVDDGHHGVILEVTSIDDEARACIRQQVGFPRGAARA